MVEDSAGIAKSLCDTMLTRSVGMTRAATGAAAQHLAATGRCETAAPWVRSEGRKPRPGANAALDATMAAAMKGVRSFILPWSSLPKISNEDREDEVIPEILRGGLPVGCPIKVAQGRKGSSFKFGNLSTFEADFMASAAARWRVALRIAVVLGWCAARCSGGASAYTLIGDVAEELDDGAIVEVGSDRGEGSTGFLSALANRCVDWGVPRTTSDQPARWCTIAMTDPSMFVPGKGQMISSC